MKRGKTPEESEEEEVPVAGVFDLILGCISKSTGSDPSDFTDDIALAELGVDSIMAIEIVATVKAESDVDLAPSFIFEYPKIADLRRTFGRDSTPPKALEADSSISASAAASTPESPQFGLGVMPDSASSSGSSMVHIEVEVATPDQKENTKRQKVDPHDVHIDISPAPTISITLLQGRPGSGKTPFYLMADGTGSSATYIHLPPFKSKMPVYGIDSPFLRCPSRLSGQVGIAGVAKLIAAEMVKARPTGSFFIGGFSAGVMVAFEVSRQLAALGRKVNGLLLIDLCCPRATLLDESEIREESKAGVAVFEAAVAKDGLWSS